MAAVAARAEAALIDREVVTPRVYACALSVLGWADFAAAARAGARSALLEAAVHECTALVSIEVRQRARQNLAFALAHAGELGRAKRALRAATAPRFRPLSCGCPTTATASRPSRPADRLLRGRDRNSSRGIFVTADASLYVA